MTLMHLLPIKAKCWCGIESSQHKSINQLLDSPCLHRFPPCARVYITFNTCFCPKRLTTLHKFEQMRYTVMCLAQGPTVKTRWQWDLNRQLADYHCWRKTCWSTLTPHRESFNIWILSWDESTLYCNVVLVPSPDKYEGCKNKTQSMTQTNNDLSALIGAAK